MTTSRRRPRWPLVLGAALAAVTALPAAAAPPVPVTSPVDLFSLAAQDGAGPSAAGRPRPVRVHADALPSGRAVALRLPLPELGARTARLRPAAPVAVGYQHWSGAVEGDPAGTVTVVRRGEQVSALIATADGAYTITTADSGAQTLLRVGADRSDADLVRTPPNAGPAGAGPAGAGPAGAGPAGAGPAAAPGGAVDDAAATAAGGDGPQQVDVLVAYTAGAAAQAGGTAAVQALAALSVAAGNDAFAASGVAVRFALVGTVPAGGTPGDASSGTLDALTAVGDGAYDAVHAERDRRGADLVSLLVADDRSYCGVAWYPEGPAYGFSVVSQACAVGNLSFPHELGHNLGAAHDAFVDPAPFYPGGSGHVDVARRWRTVMAYDDRCAASGVTCTRLGRFSNPELRLDGAPTGVAGRSDNRAALHRGAAVVAGYRAAAPVPPPAASQDGRYLDALYRDFLGRPVDAAAQVEGGRALAAGASRQQLALSLARSDEYLGVLVTRLYRDVLGRDPEPGALDHWRREIRAGLPLSAVGAGFYASQENYQRSGATPSDAGPWVEGLYRTLLERASDPGGRAGWTQEVDRLGRLHVAGGFYSSPEKLTRRVQALYAQLLGRPADPVGLAGWPAVVRDQGDLALASYLASSPEYYARAQAR